MATIRGKIWMRAFVNKNAMDLDIEDVIPETRALRVIPWPSTLNDPIRVRNFLSQELYEAG